MFEQIRKETEADAMVKFKSGKMLFGVILDYLAGEANIDNLKFVPHEWLNMYRVTEHPQFVITLKEEKVEVIDVALK